MNDGKQPRRSIVSYILPYILLAALIGTFIFFVTRSLSNRSESLTVSTLEDRIGYKIKADKSGYEFGEAKYEIKEVSISESYRATTVTGVMRNVASKNETNFYTVMTNKEYEAPYEVAIKGTSGEIKTLTHQSWSGIFTGLGAKIEMVDAFKASFWDTWGPTIISGVFILLIGLFFFSRLSKSVNGANNSVMGFNKSPARRIDKSKVKFADVAGCDAEKAEMVELVEYLKDPKKYSKYGARLPKGILLIGPPGTGKTLLAKAVAGEAGVPFYSISGSDFVEMYVGVGAGRVRDLFAKAKTTAPCLIFIDEIDAVGRQRGAGLGGGNDEREQTLNQLLVEMDGFEANSGILVIAATNRDDVLDPALRRAGRFDRTVTVSLPDKAGREAILKVHARNKTIDPSVDFGALAARTVGFSGADLDNILNEAAILAVRTGKPNVGMAEIDEAIDRRISGPAKNSKGLSAQERKLVAYHEAGHAVIGLNLPFSDKVQKITIIPRGNTGGHVLMTPEDDRFLLTKNELLARITGLLGGRTSEEMFFKDITTGASNDIQEATRLARLMVTEFGMSALGPIQYEKDTGSVFLGRDYTSTQKNFSTQIAYEIDKAVREIIDKAHEQAKEILTKFKGQVTLIAETLLEKETITAEEIDTLVKGEKPKKTVTRKTTRKAPTKKVPA